MRGTIALASLLSVLLGLGDSETWGDEPARQPVERLVEQLGDSDFQVREAANKALTALALSNPAVLPQLRKALGHPDVEVRRRLQELIPLVERTALLEPKRVTLKLTRRPLREAIAEVAKQTGYAVSLFNDKNGDQLFSLDCERWTFWEVLDKIAVEGRLGVSREYDNRIMLHPRKQVFLHVHRHGLFRLVATDFEQNHTRTIELSAAAPDGEGVRQQSNSLTFRFMLTDEPKVRILEVGEVVLTAATDDQKHSMLPPALGNRVRLGRASAYSRSFHADRDGGHALQVELGRPAPAARRIGVLRGTVPVTLLVEQKAAVVAVADVLKSKGKEFKAAGISGKMNGVEETTGRRGTKEYRLQMTFVVDQPTGYNLMHRFREQIELHDAEGHKYQAWGSSMSGSGARLDCEFTFADPGVGKLGPPAKLMYTPWVTMQYPVPFEFKDLPLP
jgi:hypothetical protein